MKKHWVAAAAATATLLALAVTITGETGSAGKLAFADSARVTPVFEAPTSVTVSSVTATGATVKFALPSADGTATSERVIVYPASNQSAVAFSATVTRSPVTVTGLKASTGYYAEVSVNAAQGHSASSWKVWQFWPLPNIHRHCPLYAQANFLRHSAIC